MTRIFRRSFNGGEVSPELWWRDDLSRHENGCRSAQNFLLRPTGAAARRPGTEYMATVPDGPCRVVPFEVSESAYYLLVLVGDQMRIHDPSGDLVLELGHPFPPESLRAIQWAQSYDVLYLAHPSVPLMRLERLSAEVFRLKRADLRGGPYKDQNTDGGVLVAAGLDPYIEGREGFAGDVFAARPNLPGERAAAGDAVPHGTTRLEPVFDGPDLEFRRAAVPLAEGFSEEEPWAIGPGQFVLFEDDGEWTPWLVVAQEDHPTNTGWKMLVVETNIPEGDPFPVEWNPGRIARVPRPQPPSWRDEAGSSAPADPEDPDSEIVNELVTESVDEDAVFVELLEDVESLPEDFGDLLEDGRARLVPEFKGRAFLAAISSGDRGPTDDDPLGRRGRPFEGAGGGRVGLFPTPWVVSGMFSHQPASPWTILHRFGDFVGDLSSNNFPYFGAVGDADGGRTTRPFLASGVVRLRTDGSTWNGKLALQYSRDGANWENLGIIQSQGNFNGEIERELPAEGGFVRLAMLAFTTTLGNVVGRNRVLFRLSVDPVLPEEYEVGEELLSPGVMAMGKGVHTLGRRFRTFRWAMGAFGGSEGYARACTIHEERLWLAGSRTSPNTLWGSQVNDWTLFASGGTLATSPLALTLASDQLNRILWMRSMGDLLVGCDDSEWIVGGSDRDRAVGPDNARASRQAAVGSDPTAPVATGDMVAYVQRGGRRVRGVRFAWESDAYVSADLVAAASHMAGVGRGFVELSFTAVPYSVILALRDDGQVAALTWDRENSVDGWARLRFGSGVESLCVAPGGIGGRCIYLVVKRPKGRALERMDFSGKVFLDCHVRGERDGDLVIVPAPVADAGAVVVTDEGYTVVNRSPLAAVPAAGVLGAEEVDPDLCPIADFAAVPDLLVGPATSPELGGGDDLQSMKDKAQSQTIAEYVSWGLSQQEASLSDGGSVETGWFRIYARPKDDIEAFCALPSEDPPWGDYFEFFIAFAPSARHVRVFGSNGDVAWEQVDPASLSFASTGAEAPLLPEGADWNLVLQGVYFAGWKVATLSGIAWTGQTELLIHLRDFVCRFLEVHGLAWREGLCGNGEWLFDPHGEGGGGGGNGGGGDPPPVDPDPPIVEPEPPGEGGGGGGGGGGGAQPPHGDYWDWDGEGGIVIGGGIDKAYAGLPVPALLRPLPPRVSDSTVGGTVLLTELWALVVESFGGRAILHGPEERPAEFLFHDVDDPVAFGPRLVTGRVALKDSSGYRDSIDLTITPFGHGPLVVAGLAGQIRRAS